MPWLVQLFVLLCVLSLTGCQNQTMDGIQDQAADEIQLIDNAAQYLRESGNGHMDGRIQVRGAGSFSDYSQFIEFDLIYAVQDEAIVYFAKYAVDGQSYWEYSDGKATYLSRDQMEWQTAELPFQLSTEELPTPLDLFYSGIAHRESVISKSQKPVGDGVQIEITAKSDAFHMPWLNNNSAMPLSASAIILLDQSGQYKEAVITASSDVEMDGYVGALHVEMDVAFGEFGEHPVISRPW